MLKQFFRDSAIYGISSIMARGISLLLLPFYTRYLTPADYGIVEILLIIINLVNLVVPLEITQGIARHYPDAKTESDKTGYASTALWFTVITYSVFVISVLCLAQPLSIFVLGSTSHSTIFQISILTMFVSAIFYFFQNQLRWELQPYRYAIANIVYIVILSSTTVLLLTMFNSGIAGIFYGQLIGSIAAGILTWYYTRHNYKPIFDRKKCTEMLRYTTPLVPSNLAIFVSLYIDRIVIQKIMTISDVGVYGIGYRFASVVGLLLAGVQGALTPLIYGNYQKLSTPAEIAKIFRYFLLAALSLVLSLAAFSHDIIKLFTTPPYYTAARVIPLLAVSTLLFNMYIMAPGLNIAKKTRLIAIINTAAAVLNTILVFLFIPLWGIIGAALATSISAFAAFTLHITLSQYYYFVPHKWNTIIVSSIVTAVLAALCWNLEDMWQLYAPALLFLKISTVVLGISILIWLLVGAKELRIATRQFFTQVKS